jgi:hypothetical protein
MKAALVVLPFVSIVAGCVGQTVDLTPGTGTSSSSLVAHRWTGYIEGYAPPSGSSKLTLTLNSASDGTLTGTLVFGDKPAPPPPSDPNVGYPPGSGSTPLDPANIEGFTYTVRNASFDGDRLRLGVSTADLWKAWCGLQQPVPAGYMIGGGSRNDSGIQDDGGGLEITTYSCDPPSYGTDDTTGECLASNVRVDCGKAALCTSMICDCTATSCTVNRSSSDVELDLALTDGRLDGSASTVPYSGMESSSSTPPIDRRNVHLTRAH